MEMNALQLKALLTKISLAHSQSQAIKLAKQGCIDKIRFNKNIMAISDLILNKYKDVGLTKSMEAFLLSISILDLIYPYELRNYAKQYRVPISAHLSSTEDSHTYIPSAVNINLKLYTNVSDTVRTLDMIHLSKYAEPVKEILHNLVKLVNPSLPIVREYTSKFNIEDRDYILGTLNIKD